MSIKSTIGEYGEDEVWYKYFMGIALLSEKRSKDRKEGVGACIVNVNDEPRVVGIGYYGMPLNCADLITWGPQGKFREGSGQEKRKHDYVCHAELNAIVNRNPKSVKGCTVYVTLFPCNECAKIIVASGIERVVYLSDEKAAKVEVQDSKKMLQENDVECQELGEKIDVDGVTDDIRFNGGSFLSDDKAISWEQYFMALAVWSGKVRSESDDLTKEGACIVNEDKRIVGLGYVQNIKANEVRKKEDCVVHSPVRAIINRSPASLKGCTLYTVRYPCNECVKMIIQCGIRKVVYLKEKDKRCQEEILQRRLTLEMGDGNIVNADEELKEKKLAGEVMLAMAGIKPEPYAESDDKMKSLLLDFTPKRPKLDETPSVSSN